MTSEDDFQRMLDTNRDAHDTRLVFADWLQDRGDPRADGYRALGLHRRIPVPGFYCKDTRWGMAGYVTKTYAKEYRDNSGVSALRQFDLLAATLPDDWFHEIPRTAEDQENVDEGWRCRDTRRKVEDATALAFAKLPTERQAELLAGHPVTAPVA